jgi:hypothetical protein
MYMQVVNTPTLKSVFERGDKECEIEGTNMSYIGIDMYECLYKRILGFTI